MDASTGSSTPLSISSLSSRPLPPIHSDPHDGIEYMGARPRKRRRVQPTNMSSHPRSRHPRHSSSSSSPGPSARRAPATTTHYPGDGLDFRRPVASTTSSPRTTPAADDDVIDLTNEPDSPQQQGPQPPRRNRRLPRFGRDIMAEVVDLEDDSEAQNNHNGHGSSSPDVQIVGSTARVLEPAPAPTAPSPSEPSGPRLPGIVHLFQMMSGERPRMRTLLGQRGRGNLSFLEHATSPSWFASNYLWLGDQAGDAVDLTLNLDRRSPPATYKPPSPPPDGFTRTVGEEDVAVCPHCESELGVGDEVKAQIWVVKQCGHVYCGECATHRSQSKAKNGRRKIEPFKICVVEGCDKAVSAPKSMCQVYL